ncbi:MAG: phenylacetate-CoA oxygenase subunit PaaC [Lewinellaceae bacterium]|jgi:ring-1,2-phenylacetyl-CoA epoxidase subunit PaaC|nr:phenylacetate-CoA oxygenase subunit PaaC [Lewinellaceae bacterium]
MNDHFHYLLQLGDNALILSQRLGEWCGHGPVLEQDIAMTNIALDLLGQARMLLSYAGELEGAGHSEDDLAYFRDAHQFRNVLLVEQPNTDWAYTIVRQFFFDTFQYFNYQALLKSRDERLSAIAEKALKEVTYHLRFSSEWMVRLGDGTEVSHKKMQTALDDLWMFSGELIRPNDTELRMAEAGIAADLSAIAPLWRARVAATLEEATLSQPDNDWMQSGGKEGRHSEHLGFVLAEMQHIQRTYPGLEW